MSQGWIWIVVVGGVAVSFPIVSLFTGGESPATPPPPPPATTPVAAAAPADEPAASRRERQSQLFSSEEAQRQRRERQAELFIPSGQAPQVAAAPAEAMQPIVAAPPGEQAAERWVVFVVPGTYGSAGSWYTLPEGQATFSSELQRNLGAKARVHPYPWRSSIQHKVREQVAENLATVIKEKTVPEDKVMLVGHSHGGNVALQAAGLCGRKIDLVVCLATPHVYYYRQQGEKLYKVPVYCSPSTLRNTADIVTLTACTDRVPDHYAELRTGLDENDAIHSSRGWADQLRGAGLAADGDWLTEIAEDVLDTKLVSNVEVESSLNVAKDNVMYPCTVPCSLGEGAHQTVHSRRIGSLLARLALARSAAERRNVVNYLHRLTQFPGEDSGEAIDEAVHRQREKAREARFQDAGWYLLTAEVTSLSDHDRTTHLFPSDPDPYFEIRSAGGGLLYLSPHRQDSKTARWGLPGVVAPPRGEISMRVCERNPLQDDRLDIQTLAIGERGPPQAVATGTWSAKLKWIPVHE